MRIGNALVLLLLVPASIGATRSDAEREFVVHPFRIERSAPVGARFAARKGEVIYREKSSGRDVAFLVAPIPGKWAVKLGPGNALYPLTFILQSRKLKFYCPDKYEPKTSGFRASLCLRDSNNDGLFDQAATGYRMQGFVIELSGHWLSADRDNAAGSAVELLGQARPIKPAVYDIRRVQPYEGDEGIIEIRYAGLKNKTPAFDLTFRMANSTAPIYRARIAAERERGGTTASLRHPVLSQRSGFTLPYPTPTMVVTVSAANATRVAGTISKPYPDWVWFRQDCALTASELIKEDSGPLPYLHRYSVGTCDSVTWEQDGSCWTLNPGSLEPEPMVPFKVPAPKK